jgi:hypothetical protein
MVGSREMLAVAPGQLGPQLKRDPLAGLETMALAVEEVSLHGCI